VARQPREDEEGGFHHVFARGNRRQPIFLDEVDRRIYLSMLGRAVERWSWRCLAYCLMDNHVHLLLETPGRNLGKGMQRLHSVFAQTHNARHGLVGHLFQGRYGAVRVTTDAQLWAVAEYIARNPVEAGLCERPEDFAWSSRGAVAVGRTPGWLDAARLQEFLAAV
jgi:REP element-mobilizing transposase RayT